MKKMMKKMTKNKHSLTYRGIFSEFIFFCNYGQFFREGRKVFVFTSNLFNSAIWIFFSLLCGNILFEAKLNLLTWIGFILCFRCFFAAMDRFGEIGIPYSLSYNYPISDAKILSLRIFAKWLQPSEWAFVISCFLILWFSGFGIVFSIIGGILMSLLIQSIEEIISYIAYKTPNVGLFYFLFILSEIAIIVCALIFKEQQNKIDNLAITTLIGELLLFVVVGVLFAFLFRFFKRPRSGFRSGQKAMLKKAKRRKSGKKYTTIGVLLNKEISFLVKYKISLVVEALFSAVLFLIISDKNDAFNVLLPLFFCFELASSYGFNYFGSEEGAYQLTILSPIDRNLIIKVKSLAFIVIAYMGSMFMLIASLVSKRISFSMQIVDSIALCTLAIAVLLLINPLFSTRFFKINGQKNPHGIKSFLCMLAIYIALCGVIAILYYLINNTIVMVVASLFLMLIAIFATILLPTYYAEKLAKGEHKMLKIITNAGEN